MIFLATSTDAAGARGLSARLDLPVWLQLPDDQPEPPALRSHKREAQTPGHPARSISPGPTCSTRAPRSGAAHRLWCCGYTDDGRLNSRPTARPRSPDGLRPQAPVRSAVEGEGLVARELKAVEAEAKRRDARFCCSANGHGEEPQRQR